MFGIGISEMALIALIGFLLFGPEELPKIASWIGKTSFKAKKLSDELRREWYNSVYKPIEEEKLQAQQAIQNLKNETTALTKLPAERKPEEQATSGPAEEGKSSEGKNS